MHYPLPSPEVLIHVVDAHCHPTDAVDVSSEDLDKLQITICAMSTMQADQPRVRKIATSHPSKVVPCFGQLYQSHHPWFTHQIALAPGKTKEEHYRSLFLNSTDLKPGHEEAFSKLLPNLPSPTLIDDILSDLRKNLAEFPNAMLGEVGLDRSFRVAIDFFASQRELTPFIVPLEHQMKIVEAQIKVALELRRNISFHSVKSQLATAELLDRMAEMYGEDWFRTSIDLHSCGLSPQTWKEIEKKHPNAFLSLSTVINVRSPNHRALIAACSPDRLLVESDINNINHCAQRTWDMLNIISEVKEWPLETGWKSVVEKEDWGTVRRVEANWQSFIAAGHHKPKKRENHKTR